MPGEFARADVMLQASKYDPCPMAVIEALASGVPIVGTAEVGSIEGVDPEVAIVVEPGDVDGLAAGIETMLERMRRDPERMRSLARAEAERRFAPSVVCRQISDALQALARASGPSPREHRTSHARERAPV